MTTNPTGQEALIERLERAADDLVSGATIFSDHVHGLLIEAAEALSSSPETPEGYVLVPVEPEDTRLDAGVQALVAQDASDLGGPHLTRDRYRECLLAAWSTMLSSSPNKGEG